MFTKKQYTSLESDSEQHLLERRNVLTELSKSYENVVLHRTITVVEVVLGIIVLVGFLKTHYSSMKGLDILSFNNYNTSMPFKYGSYLLKGTDEANTYWRDLLASGGVVSLDTKLAQSSGLKRSATSPTDSSQSIYQVDVFHALHCLNSIRQNLVPETKHEWNEKHVLHCLDYIRHQLLCSPDVSLITTNDLDEFVSEDTHQCKDYSAVVDWVERHKWKEFPEFIKNKTKTS